MEESTDDHDAQAVRRDVEQEHVHRLVDERGGLNGGSQRHDLIGVDALARFEPEELGDALLNERHSSHAADEDDVVEVVAVDVGFRERLLADRDRAVDQVAREFLEFVTRERLLHVERLPAGRRVQERKVDERLAGDRQLAASLFGSVLDPL